MIQPFPTTLEHVASLLGEGTRRSRLVCGGRDQGSGIAVRELEWHTAGISDCFEREWPDDTTFFADALRGDVWWSCDECIELARDMPSRFVPPGSPGIALYCATGRDLHISGTVNQMRSRSLPYPLLSRLAAQFR